MEAIGAAASIFAMGQAVHAGVKALRLLRSIPEIQQEYYGLLEELDMLGAIIKEWQSEFPGSDAEKPESPVLRMTRNMLAHVVRRLEKLSLGHAPGDSGPQKTLGKRQSLRFKHEIFELRGKVRDARNNLILAVTLASKQAIQQQSQTLCRLEGSASLFSVRLEAEMSTIKDLRSQPAGEHDNDRESTAEDGNDGFAAQVNSRAPQNTAVTTAVNRQGHDAEVQSMTWVAPKCTPTCSCKCHFRRAWQLPGSLEFVLGSLKLSWSANGSGQCQRCQASSTSLSYRSPPWLGMCLLAICVSSSRGCTLQASLRPIRVLITGSDAMQLVCGLVTINPNSELQRVNTIRLTQGLRPNDEDVAGNQVLWWLLNDKCLLPLALSLWDGTAAMKGVSARTALRALSILSGRRVLDDRAYLLRRVVSSCEELDDCRRTDLHDALAEDGDIAPILQQQPWTVDVRDSAGMAPIHIAVTRRNSKAVGLLILAGADLEILCPEGDTPLMLATEIGDIGSVAALLSAGCNVYPQEARHNALYTAVRSNLEDSIAILRLLLRAGSRKKAQAGAITSLAEGLPFCRQSRSHIEQKCTLLLDAGADINHPDSYGKTPLTFCLISNNVVVLQCLLEAGALWCRPRHDYNVLGAAFFFGKTETLEYLCGCPPLQDDHRRRNFLYFQGNTVWDQFLWHLFDPLRRADLRFVVGPRPARAFTSLYTAVRDKCLTDEICTLEEALTTVSRRDATSATEVLGSLADNFMRLGLHDVVKTYKTVQLQVREAMWEAAYESIHERLEVLCGERASSPWEMPHWLWENELAAPDGIRTPAAVEEYAEARRQMLELREVMVQEWRDAHRALSEGESGWEAVDEDQEGSTFEEAGPDEEGTEDDTDEDHEARTAGVAGAMTGAVRA